MAARLPPADRLIVETVPTSAPGVGLANESKIPGPDKESAASVISSDLGNGRRV